MPSTMKGSVEPSVYVVRDSMPTEKWCTQARASLHSYSLARPPCGCVWACAGVCLGVRVGACAWACTCGVARVCVCSSLSLSLSLPLGVCLRWLAFFASEVAFSLALSLSLSASVGTCFLHLLSSVLVVSSLSLLSLRFLLGTCFLAFLLPGLLTLFLGYLLSYSLLTLFSLFVLWLFFVCSLLVLSLSLWAITFGALGRSRLFGRTLIPRVIAL